MFQRHQKNNKSLIDFLKYIKNLPNTLKNFLSLIFVLVAVLWLNSDSNQIKLDLYNLGYNLYGESSQFFRKIYDQFTICQSDQVNNKLINEKKYLEQKNIQLENELKLIKSQIKFINNQKYKYVTAIVTQVTYPKDEPVLVISAGSKNGLNIGNIVINEDGIIGRIESVSEKFSLVSLLGNDNVKIPAIIDNAAHNCIIGKKSIKYQNLLEVNYITEKNKIKNNAIVLTSGKDGASPYGIQIGQIKLINNKIFVIIKNNPINSTVVSIIVNE